MTTAAAITEGYWADGRRSLWCDTCLLPSVVMLQRRVACVDEHGATSLLVAEHGYCIGHADFMAATS